MNKERWLMGLLSLGIIQLAYAQTPPIPTAPTKTVAVVNGVTISKADLEKAVIAHGPLPTSTPEAQKRIRQIEALGMLIDEILMRQYLEKKTPPVSPQEVNRRLTEIEAGLQKQTPSRSLAEFCQETNHTLDQLRNRVADLLRWSAYTSVKITDTDLERYYHDNKDFFDGTTLQVSHIVIRIPQNATQEERISARKNLEKIRDEITKGKADFAAMAKKYSQDPTADKGGEIEAPVGRKWFDESFARAAFALKVGEMSDIVQSEFGMHLIKVTGRNEGKKAEFKRIKEAVREMYAEELRQKILSEQRAEARKKGSVKIDLP